jgi:hypothetical protein
MLVRLVWQRIWQWVVRSVVRVMTRHTFGSTSMRTPPRLTRDDLLAALDRIDAEDWDSRAATQLLQHCCGIWFGLKLSPRACMAWPPCRHRGHGLGDGLGDPEPTESARHG